MMTKNRTEKIVRRWLVSLGLKVQQIEEDATKTPDLLVSDGTCKYLIEIKDKLPDPEIMRQRERVLHSGEIWNEEAPLDYNKRVSEVIRKGVTQLSSFDRELVDFRLLWLHARHRYEDMQLQQFQATQYGTIDLLDLAESSTRPCFFFTFSEFYRLRIERDGAFVAADDKNLLCLNIHSPRFEKLKNSQLCKLLRGICDPIALEQTGDAYIAGCEVSRNDRAAVLEYVRNKYKRPQLIDVQPMHLSGEIDIRLPEPARIGLLRNGEGCP